MIRVGDFRLDHDDMSALEEVLRSGRISEDRKTREFENKFADYIGTTSCVACSSGTAALLLIMRALLIDDRFPKFKPGAKVITSPVTYVATSNAIVLSGLLPVYVDINPSDFTLDVGQVEDLLKRGDCDDYAAILPVHLMGYPNAMRELQSIADRYDLVLIEDSAQAHGSLYDGRTCGSMGLLSAFSFYIAHNIQAGEMGAVCTSDNQLKTLIKKLKANGRACSCAVCTRSRGYCALSDLHVEGEPDLDCDPRFTHDVIGYNFKTMEFQAALGVSQLSKADHIFQTRQSNVRLLNTLLDDLQDDLELPLYRNSVSYLAYPFKLTSTARMSRKEFRRTLEESGVENRPLFGCIPTQQPAYRHLRDQYRGTLPNAERVGRQGLYVGCHQYLVDRDMELIAHSIRTILKERG